MICRLGVGAGKTLNNGSISARPPPEGWAGAPRSAGLDDDAAAECALELLDEDVRLVDCSVLKDSDGGDVAHGLPGREVGLAQATRGGPEEAQDPDEHLT